jgi:hypothetical protein
MRDASYPKAVDGAIHSTPPGRDAATEVMQDYLIIKLGEAPILRSGTV